MQLKRNEEGCGREGGGERMFLVLGLICVVFIVDVVGVPKHE